MTYTSSSGSSAGAAPFLDASATAAASEDHTCTICCETPLLLDSATLPPCGHTFCASCVLSWSAVRALCPNCKTPFSSLLVARNPETGDALPSQVPVDAHVLLTSPWVSLTALLPVVDDIASAFNVAFSPEERRRDHDLASAATGVPNFTCEEVEDAAEDAFWAAEELMYREEFPAVARSTRVMANRRHGANGYLASGHLAARAGQSTPTPPQGRSKGPTRANASSESHNPTDQEHKPQGSSSKRKKKVKKNSRGAAGHLAAADASSAPDVKPIAAVVTDVASEGGGLVPAVPRGGES
jgi:Zinc finger, C3HC4 type (RING finger)